MKTTNPSKSVAEALKYYEGMSKYRCYQAWKLFEIKNPTQFVFKDTQWKIK